MPEPTPVQEIIIVRRRGHGDGDGHHGGVWKIAFADFMTAMMAFFLVLWIVNSTSKGTRSSVARYFNPIKLADTTPARKGLNDPKDSDFDAAATAPHAEAPKSKPEKNAPEHANEPSKADSKEKPAKDAQKVEPAKAADAKAQAIGQLRPPAATDAKLFEDPYAALAEIAAKGEKDDASLKAGPGAAESETGTPFRALRAAGAGGRLASRPGRSQAHAVERAERRAWVAESRGERS